MSTFTNETKIKKISRTAGEFLTKAPGRDSNTLQHENGLSVAQSLDLSMLVDVGEI